jgi:hypothetical protein
MKFVKISEFLSLSLSLSLKHVILDFNLKVETYIGHGRYATFDKFAGSHQLLAGMRA